MEWIPFIMIMIFVVIFFIVGIYLEYKRYNQVEFNDNYTENKKRLLQIYGYVRFDKNSYKKTFKMVLILLVIWAGLFIYVFLGEKFWNNDLFLNIVQIIFGGLVLICIFAPSIVQERIFLNVKKFTKEIYHDAVINRLFRTDIMGGYLKTKYKYKYEILINEYACKVVNLLVYKQERRIDNGTILFHKYYMLIKNKLIYQYDVKNHVLKNMKIGPLEEDIVSADISEKLKENLLELQKSRLFKIKIENQKVIIQKYLLLDSFKIYRTIREDIDDIREFYEKIICEL